MDAVRLRYPSRASLPRFLNSRGYIDGRIVNPGPVTLCRALGAETIIAVDQHVEHTFNLEMTWTATFSITVVNRLHHFIEFVFV